MAEINTENYGINNVDLDKVLEFDQVLDAITSDKFNTENLLVIPTTNGLDLGLKVQFKNRQGNVCHDVRYVVDFCGTPIIYIGQNDLYDEHFPANTCFVPVERQVCDSKETNWFHHNVSGFPVFTNHKYSAKDNDAKGCVFNFSPESYDSEYAIKDKNKNYLSQKGLSVLVKYILSNPQEVADRIAKGITNGQLSPEGAISLDLASLDKTNLKEQEL
jgi:hypothetical protein